MPRKKRTRLTAKQRKYFAKEIKIRRNSTRQGLRTIKKTPEKTRNGDMFSENGEIIGIETLPPKRK